LDNLCLLAYYILWPWMRLSTRKLVFTEYYWKKVESVLNRIVTEGHLRKIDRS